MPGLDSRKTIPLPYFSQVPPSCSTSPRICFSFASVLSGHLFL